MTNDQDSREENQDKKAVPPALRNVSELISSLQSGTVLGKKANDLLKLNPVVTESLANISAAFGKNFEPMRRQIDALVAAAHTPIRFESLYGSPIFERPMPSLAGYARKPDPKDVENLKLRARIAELEEERDYWRDAYIGAVPEVEIRSRDSK